MKSRRNKSVRAGDRKKKGATDISPSTSLPPLVEGQLRCFLQVTVSKILWTVSKPPSSVLVRLRWWGETSDGTVFRPRDTSQTEQKGVKTTTRYAVRCGPKQFTSYLTDMGALVFELMTKLDHLPIGRVQINGIPQLSPTHPLSGFFTIVSPTSEKLGELQVYVSLEPLSETYDSSNSSIINTDISVDTAVSQPRKLSLPSAGHKDSESSSRVTTPRGRDHLYFQENSDPNKGLFRGSQDHLNNDPFTETISAKKQMPYNCINPDKAAIEQLRDLDRPHSSPATKDLLSALLDQGSKLRDAMVVSALRSDPNMDLDIDSVVPPTVNKLSSSLTVSRSAPDASSFLKNLLNVHKSSSNRDILIQPTDITQSQLEAHTETRAVELLLGSSTLSPGHYWDGTGSPPESISGGSDFYNESELNDPHYDQSLLEKLFYTASKSDSSLSDFISDDDHTKSRRKKAKNKIGKDWKLDQTQTEYKSVTQESEDLPSRDTRTAEKSLKAASETEGVNLSFDRLALLGRMHTARVFVESLRVPSESTQVTPSKSSSKGKPPRPSSSVKRTYFVEFHFPVSSKNRAGEVAAATEITRLVSSKIVGGLVKFKQRFVFPVLFTGQMIEHWWNTDLTFKVFLRKGSEKKPGLIGAATLSLCEVLRSEDLTVTCGLPVKCVEQEKIAVGPLKVSVELAGENRDLLSAAEKTSVQRNPTPSYSTNQGVTIAEPETYSASDIEPSVQVQPLTYIPPIRHAAPRPIITERPQASLSQDVHRPPEEDGLLLHVVLMVPEGKGLVAAGVNSSSTCNSYLNCKLFSAQEATRSNVVWGTAQPAFNFSQVAPVTLTNQLLERLKNNVMIIEVWNKVPSPGQDQLLGLAKLSLHQFYMSFSDSKISRLLLQAQYPVVAVDSFVPVTDVFSGSERGKLKVLLAMGSGDQVVALQRLKNDEGSTPAQLQRPAHFLDPPQPQASLQTCWPKDEAAEHIFEIYVENVKGLTPLQSTVWGEADCYVKYSFPAISQDTSKGAELPESGITLKSVRTATTLCVPDPVFNDRQSHTLVAQSDTPVQRLLLSAFSMQGLCGGGGVPFEVWCRYYYPNVRDQMVAKGVLPLSRLCAMVTMQRREEVGIQAFSLPLTPRSEDQEGKAPQSFGLLNVSMTYRRSMRNPVGMLATRMVSISVQIHRASGLQAAARLVAEHDPSFQYTADVGVNSYVTIHPSFLPDMEKRSTRTVARSFAPEFDHHSEFPCNLVIQRSGGETCSLAEVLHYSHIVFSIHHQSVATAASARAKPAGDCPLGVVKIPAKELITKRSGITGWYPVTVPEDAAMPSNSGIMQSIVGGLEVSIRFAHHSDRERILEVAQSLGWSDEEDVNEPAPHGSDEWENKEDLVTLSVSIPKLWLPVHCLLLAGHRHIHKSTYCYFRYKLYDKEAICSHLKRPKLSEDGQQATVMFEQTKSIELMRHQPLVWYLREERLEIQVWRSYGKDTSGARPQDTDRLLGCAYVDLTGLAENSSRTLTVSGVYPMFKSNISNLWGAAVRVHLSLSSAYHQSGIVHALSYSEERSYSEDDELDGISGRHEDEHPAKGLKTVSQPDVPQQSPTENTEDVDLENTFTANIVVERAMHLSLRGSPLTERAVSVPSCCVSFSVACSSTPITTPVVENTESPMWNFHCQARLTKELLLDPQQTLVFKVWHKTDVERVLGFASVDLSPLLTGFQSICGWYNIGDFAGQCQGQLKVSITPLESIAHLKEEKWTRNEATSAQTEVTSQRSFLYQPSPAFCGSFSSYSMSCSEELSRPTSDFQTSERRDNVSALPFLRHEEHMQNVRRFHESLQQVERNTHSAEHLDLLSQTSRSSLLSGLRKNLSELDDIQKYFNQKLYRSISNGPPEGRGFPTPRAEAASPNPVSTSEDSDAQLLLKRSNLLVSQVSNLITDLQGIPKTSDVPLSNFPGRSSIQQLDTREETDTQSHNQQSVEPISHKEPIANNSEIQHVDAPPVSLVESATVGGEMLNEYGEREKEEEEHFKQQEEYESGSDEDYDEDLIEPRTLNEITTMTDRTSPWSSILSDAEADFIEQPLSTRPLEQPMASSHYQSHSEETDLFSDLHLSAQTVIPDGITSGESQSTDGVISSKATTISSAANDDAELETDHGLKSSQRHRVEEDLMESGTDITKNIKGDTKEPYSIFQRVPTGISSDSENEDYQVQKTIRKADSSLVAESDDCSSDSPPLQSVSSKQITSASEESQEELPVEPDNTTTKSSDLLPEAELLPNFFLPPQHLEASLRMLSLSPALPTTTDKAESRSQLSRGIPFRRHTHTKPTVTLEDRSKEETNRIARIFSAQFTKK
ncbi:C2 domain-containing protein 3 [Discoglossus pictus]